jgi:putative membrane protein
VAVISLGFLVSRFSLWLYELSSSTTLRRRPPRIGTSFVIGELMMGFGGLLGLLAAWRYHVVNRDIERGRVSADRGLVFLVTGAIALLAVAMVIYMVQIGP